MSYIVKAEVSGGRVHEYGPFQQRVTAEGLVAKIAGSSDLGSVVIEAAETAEHRCCCPGLRYKT